MKSSLKPIGVDIRECVNIQTAFEIDFKALPTTTSVELKIADIKHFKYLKAILRKTYQIVQVRK